MVGAGLLINLLAPPSPQKRRKSSQAEARADQEIFFPRGKKISLSPKLFYSIMAKAKKNIAVEENTHTNTHTHTHIHTFFLKKMDEDKS